jgi:uncharacterized protein YndB with AHSA1/START domain
MKQNTAKKKSAVKKPAKTAVSKAKKTAKPAPKAAKKAIQSKAKPPAKKSAAPKKKVTNVKKVAPKAPVKKTTASKTIKAGGKKAVSAKAVKSKNSVAKEAKKPKAVIAAKTTKPVSKKDLSGKAKKEIAAVAKVKKEPVNKVEKEVKQVSVDAVAAAEKKPTKENLKKKTPVVKPKRLIIEPPQLKSQAAMTGKAINPINQDNESGKAKHKYKKFELEFSINSAHHILFNYVATSAGLREWFADEVIENGDLFTFVWDGAEQQAQLISVREDHHIRFHWLDLPVGTYFEFKLEADELTGDLALIITDFAEDADSVESGKSLWQTQIDALFHLIGAHS